MKISFELSGLEYESAKVEKLIFSAEMTAEEIDSSMENYPSVLEALTKFMEEVNS